MTATLAEVDMNGKDVRTESLLEAWGISFHLEPEFPVNKIKIEDVSQVREESHRAPRQNVDQYAAQMGAGAKFPPIVVTNGGFLVDGNTRLAAARKNGHTTFPAYIAKMKQTQLMPLVGASLNQTGGQRLTSEEAQTAAEGMMSQSFDDSTIARYVGRTVHQVRNYRKERDFRELADEAGLTDEDTQVPKTVQRKLASINHLEPFKAAVKAVADKKVTAKDLDVIVKAGTSARSDADAVENIKKAADDLGAQGPPPKRRTRKTDASKFLAQAEKLVELAGADPMKTVYEPDSEQQKAHKDTMCKLQTVAATLCEAYVG